MAVQAVSGIFAHSEDPTRQQNGLRQDLQTLQRALSAGNLVTAQKALSQFQQDLQAIRPQQNGVRASVAVNPQGSMRSDLQALQSALDSGDLGMAEKAFAKIQQDSQQISNMKPASQGQSGPAKTMPQPQENNRGGVGPSVDESSQESKGNLLDVSA